MEPASSSNSSHQRAGSLPRMNDRTPNSPCFVHSHLDPGNNLVFPRNPTRHERSRSKQINPPLPPIPQGHPSPCTLSPTTPRPNAVTLQDVANYCDGGETRHDDAGNEGEEHEDSDDDNHESMTRQLAETATSVREISKQLGRTRIQSVIQSVLIITKARDNHLVRLTRELVISLAHELDQPSTGAQPSPKKSSSTPSRRLVIYVDEKLRHSTRFDRPGLEREYPEWFRPLTPRHRFQRRLSRTNSVSSVSSLQSLRSSHSSASTESLLADEGRLRYWTPEMCSRSPELFDLVITLGGDGTVLFASWLFQRVVPPIIPFALGSLGFLTNFDYADHRKVLHEAIKLGVRVNLRMRFSCTVYRACPGQTKRRAIRSGKTGEIFMKTLGRAGWEALESGSVPSNQRQTSRSAPRDDKEIACFSTYPAESFQVLNELVVDRGPSPYVSLLELFGDDHHMTTVQADGLTVSTPTGSTAYSLSAGGSLVHPEIPTMLITPICPHTLSFRPMLLPDTMELRICVPYTSRSTAWASFDGRGRVELRQGDHIKVTASAYPFPTVCDATQSVDWFHAISRTLKWNERERQKSFVVIEEDGARPINGTSHPTNHIVSHSKETNHEEIDEDEAEDEDDDQAEEYDIDDDSTEVPLKTTSERTHLHLHDQPTKPTDRRSSDSAVPPETNSQTIRNPSPSRPVIIHGRALSKNSNPNLKAFAVWGLDSSSSSDGSMSDC